ncbi:MAG TPA: transcriptional repressor [Acidimicrobiales bacterium]|nr:transcriptional repressor [Acidimicrobiales bacterium]
MGRRGVISAQVIELLRDSDQHCWTIEDLQEAMAQRGLSPDLSSVFRAVTRLESEGQLAKVPIDTRRGHYELAGDHHEHLVCESCGRIEAVACSAVASLVDEILVTSGFTVQDHWMVLSGTCAACAGSAPAMRPGGDR